MIVVDVVVCTCTVLRTVRHGFHYILEYWFMYLPSGVLCTVADAHMLASTRYYLYRYLYKYCTLVACTCSSSLRLLVLYAVLPVVVE